MRYMAWDLWLGISGLGSLAWNLGLISSAWDFWLGIFGFGSWAWGLWLGIFGLGSLAWYLWLGSFGLGFCAWGLGLLRLEEPTGGISREPSAPVGFTEGLILEKVGCF